MYDEQLKKILNETELPPVDKNAKKRAVNLAVAEFKDIQKEKQKISQGSSLLSRLMGKTTNRQGRNKMKKSRNKRMVYGGMATAMAVVLIAGVSLTQLQDMDAGVGGNTTAAQMGSVQYGTSSNSGETQFGKIAYNITIRRPSFFGGRKQEEVHFESEEQIFESDSQYVGRRPAVSESNVVAAKKPMRMAQGMIIAEEISPMEYKDVGRDQFEDFKINPIKVVSEEPVSTFSIDVDTASYSFVRRQLNHGVLPQKDAVRIEEMINYFDYNYPMPETKEEPFKASVALTPSPWAEGKKLMHIGIKGYDIQGEKPKSNLVFLLDVSGSMNSHDKLPLVKQSMKMLLDTLNPDDTIAIAVYAGAAGTVLEPTPAKEKGKIIAALDRLSAGGSTAGAEGINLAYQLAEQNFDKDAVNRVILATDGDFNVGITSREELKDFVERKREKGIYLSVLGFGQGNYNDYMMQVLAQNGNGVAAYIDNLNEARKVLVDEASSTLFPIAKDVKIQVEFNPATVAEYRLVGYETRHLNREDFNNDAVDAGDIGAGHTVTAIYEITPVGSESVSVDPLRYGAAEEKAEAHKAKTDFGNEYAFLKIRYKLPDENKSNLITTPVTFANQIENMPEREENGEREYLPIPAYVNEFNFATAVAGFAQLLKGGQYTGDLTYEDVIEQANASKGEDKFGYRAEFIQMVRLAQSASTIQPR